METGYLCESALNGKSLLIENNNIDATHNGIFLYQNDLATLINVNTNNISISDPGGMVYNSSGIKIEENGNSAHSEAIIYDNVIGIDYGYHGMYMNGAEDYHVYNNTVNLYNSEVNYAALGLYYCEHDDVHCNYFYGSAYDEYNGSYSPRGLTLASSVNNGIKCNTYDDLYCAISLEENCNGSEFKRNYFNDHTYGFRANAQSSLYNQVDAGNYWNDCSITVGAINQNNIALWRFITNDDCPFIPYNWQAAYTWFSQTSLNDPYECSNEFEDCEVRCLAIIEPSPFNELDSLIVSSELNFQNFEQEMKWNVSRNLYQKILVSDTAEVNSYFLGFADSLSIESAGQYQDIHNQTISLQMDESTLSDLHLVDSVINLLYDSLHQVNILFNTAQNSTDSVFYHDLFMTLLNEIYINTFISDSILSDYNLQKSALISDLIAQNETLPEDEAFELNEKAVNSIYLQTIASGIDTLTTAQRSILSSIACLCPVSGGLKAVYTARSLLSKYDGLYYDDAQICLQEGISKNKQSPKPVFKTPSFFVTPNPAVTYLQVSWQGSLDEPCIFSLRDITGQVVQDGNFIGKNSPFLLQLRNVSNGLYILQLQTQTGVIKSFKVVITK